MKNKTDDPNQNRNKLALILIAIGLIAGGIVGITRLPPAVSVDGWTSEEYPDLRIPITDQNDDGIEDILYWFNPIDYDHCEDCGQLDERDMTAKAEILSGKDGRVLSSRLYGGEDPWYLIPHDKFKGVITANNDFVFPAWYLINGGSEAMESKTTQFDISKTSLIRIDLDTLTIEEIKNIFDMGWESSEPIGNITKYQNEADANIEQNLNSYNPSIEYFGNWSIPIPGLSYDDDVLVFRNWFQFTNSSGDFYDNVTYSFINPITLETLTTLTWKRALNIAENATTYFSTGWCEGPTFSYQEGWKMPYFWVVSYHDIGSGVDNLTISVAPISELNNVSTSINWMVNNLTFSRMEHGLSTEQPLKVMLSLNSTKKPVSLAILHYSHRDTTGCITEEEKENNMALLGQDENTENSNYDFSTYFGEHDYGVRVVSDARLNVFNIQGPTPINTFTYESYLPEVYDGDRNDINTSINQEITGLGVINDIIPIKLDDAPGLANTSIALICTKGEYYSEQIDHFYYPIIQFEILTLNKSCIGLTVNGLHNGTFIHGVSANMFSLLLTQWGDYYVDVRFDVDGDHITDVPIPGFEAVEGIDDTLSEIEDKPVNAPFAIITQDKIIDEFYWSLPWYRDVRFVSDLNEDGIPDALIGQESVAFISIEEQVQLSTFERILADPVSSVLFFIGIGCVIGGIVLLGFIITKLRKSRISLKTIHKKRQFLMLLIALISVTLLYVSLITILSGSSGSQGTQIGLTPEQSSLNQLYATSNIATFVFLLMIPTTAGIFLLLSPITADGIVALNQIRFAKRAGLEAAIKKEAIKDVEEKAHTNYQILFIPPFGRREKGTIVFGRLLGVMALGLAIGLNVHDLWFTYSGDTLPTSITSITDPNFGIYCSGLFTFLILPGILAIPLFFWLLPTSWLLDDAGVLFYAKRLDSRKPEDVERVGGWFSNYLKGFLGISAIVSYVRFIIESPITASQGIAATDDVSAVYFFVFGFPIISGLAIGLVALIMHEFTLPRNANYLYKRLADRKVAFRRSEIQILKHEELTPDDVTNGFLEKPAKLKKSKKPKKSKKSKKSSQRDEIPEPVKEEVIPEPVKEDVIPEPVKEDVIPEPVKDDEFPKSDDRDEFPREY